MVRPSVLHSLAGSRQHLLVCGGVTWDGAGNHTMCARVVHFSWNLRMMIHSRVHFSLLVKIAWGYRQGEVCSTLPRVHGT